MTASEKKIMDNSLYSMFLFRSHRNFIGKWTEEKKNLLSENDFSEWMANEIQAFRHLKIKCVVKMIIESNSFEMWKDLASVISSKSAN